MKLQELTLISITFLTIGLTLYYSKNSKIPKDDFHKKFLEFKIKFRKFHPTEEEFLYRYEIFTKNYKKVTKKNSENHSYKLEINKFGDMTFFEFSENYLFPFKIKTKFEKQKKKLLKGKIDWRLKNHVSKIKDQNGFNNGLAFSVVSCIESGFSIFENKKFLFSEQELIDCSGRDYDMSEKENFGEGFLGKEMSDKFVKNNDILNKQNVIAKKELDNLHIQNKNKEKIKNFLKKANSKKALIKKKKKNRKKKNKSKINSLYNYISKNGLSTADQYPYLAKPSKCKKKKTHKRKKIKYFKKINPKNINGLIKALKKQPISVAIEINEDFMFYKNGIFKAGSDCGTFLNHWVVIVGYFNEGQDLERYFVGKNSWGEDWGEDGFFRIDVGHGNGTCGVAAEGVFPVLFG